MKLNNAQEVRIEKIKKLNPREIYPFIKSLSGEVDINGLKAMIIHYQNGSMSVDFDLPPSNSYNWFFDENGQFEGEGVSK